jgi:hypothetical protein
VVRARFGTTIAALLCIASANAAEPLLPQQIRDTMIRVEALLEAKGIPVAGYAKSAPPAVEFVTASHPYLQGRDGGYIAGQVYLNEDGIPACADLVLLHELVHDATLKHRLFASVPNERLKSAIEALADAVTEAAAEEPYRPGCLPHREFALSHTELAALALTPAAP